jgi:hypothetical protein
VFIIEFLDQPPEFGQVFLAKLVMLGEMRDQRCNSPTEQAIEQTLALRMHIVGALEQGSVEVAATHAFRSDGTLISSRLSSVLTVGSAQSVLLAKAATTPSELSGCSFHNTSMTRLSASLIDMDHRLHM